MDPYRNIRIDQNDNDEDIQCDVCLESYAEEGNEIVLCDLCNVATHQSCYGSELLKGVPVGQWFCQRCSVLKADVSLKYDEIKCFLCPDVDGLIKRVSCGNFTNIWAHAVCINWMPEMWFVDDEKEALVGDIVKERFGSVCNKCKRKEGAVIQCDFKNCALSYHTRCAIRKGCIKPWEEMQEELGYPEGEAFPMFCKKHNEKAVQIYRNNQESIKSNKRNPKMHAIQIKEIT